ncbi:ikaros family zinc finger protein-like isoform X1 [Biomphalaria pfeifferi]|uniref:Ikaros family zinc finger protein-like isoform X1 n=1 Tax=Biomphalaria pfeifferi TaxID=112525 RepID=A0AAD8FM37_BIOPF|nr:ikaros family zinc finger protein-like isoform X1 [Biomphalaria pfeifferi]
MMAEDSQSPQEISSLPDSISDQVDVVESVVSTAPTSTELTSVTVEELVPTTQATSTKAESSAYVRPNGRLSLTKDAERNAVPACTIAPIMSRGSDFLLSGSSASAFRPFVTQTSTREITSSSSHNQNSLTSTPVSRRAERLTLPGASTFMSFNRTTPTPSPHRQLLIGDSGNNNEENEDGRTTASAPPCTPAPEPHLQPQSPFRNNRQIKKIDLLAMSRSRQSDRAENARRDGRLAPSPRKKDEVLRNSGFTFPASRVYEAQSSLRLSMQNSRLAGADSGLSPERLTTGTLSTSSPNIDVVSVDDQPDPTKCMFSIQFSPAEQVLKCSICGFFTSNQRIYRRHRRLHTRQYQPNLIHCNLCDFSTTQIRKMREHTISSHHLSHPQSLASSSQAFNPPAMLESNHRPSLQSQIFMGNGSMFHPVTNRPVNIAIGAASATAISSASTLALPTYLTPSQEPQIHVNTQAGLQHPPRGSAMLGNYAPSSGQEMTNYMHSVISNLMSPHTDPNNSVSSSDLYLMAARNFPQESHTALPSTSVPVSEASYNFRRFWNNNSNSFGNNQNTSASSFVKVKSEPRAAPINQMSRTVPDLPSSTQKDRQVRSPRRQSDNIDSESGMDMSSDDHACSPQPGGLGSRSDARVSTDTLQTSSTAQADDPPVSSQCSVPFIKIEFPPHREACNYLNCNTHMRTDREVQCEIISASNNHCRPGGRTQSETVSSAGGSAVMETRCYFCGVTFDDEVLYSIHIGCHSHTDPFMCNVCGKQCHNKYGFYSHIMRGHQSRPNT